MSIRAPFQSADSIRSCVFSMESYHRAGVMQAFTGRNRLNTTNLYQFAGYTERAISHKGYKRMVIRNKCLWVLLFLGSSVLAAELKLPTILGDDMVLQRNVEAPLWGTADANAKVAVKLDTTSLSATADANGKWLVKLPATQAGGPHEITIQSGDQTLTLKNILFGEVWLCSGQSNM